jgi:peroxiredoxin
MSFALGFPSATGLEWSALHLFYRIEYGAWSLLSPEEQISAKTQMSELVQEIQANQQVHLQVFGMISPKADIGFILTGPDIHAVHEAEKRLSLALGPDILSPAYSFFSLLPRESSGSATQDSSEEGDTVCFFAVCRRQPSTVRKAGPHENPVDGEWLRAAVYKQEDWFPGNMVWIGKASGLEDAEWGVTLFCRDVMEISRTVHHLRSDSEVSRRIETGEPYVGLTLPLDALFRRMQI